MKSTFANASFAVFVPCFHSTLDILKGYGIVTLVIDTIMYFLAILFGNVIVYASLQNVVSEIRMTEAYDTLNDGVVFFCLLSLSNLLLFPGFLSLIFLPLGFIIR